MFQWINEGMLLTFACYIKENIYECLKGIFSSLNIIILFF